MSGDNSTVQFEQSATRDVQRLCHGDKRFGSKFNEFVYKFQANKNNPGLGLEKLNTGKQELYSARINQSIRAILLPPQGRVWTIVRVGGHELYDEIKRTVFTYSATDGRVEYAVTRTELAAESRHDTTADSAPEGGPFAAWTDAELVELGVNKAFLPSVRSLRTEAEAEGFLSDLTGLSNTVLESLLLGMSYDEVYEQITEPSGAVAAKDFDEALSRSRDRMASSDAVIDAVLAEDWSAWRLFLHPDQRGLVDKDYRGPARVSGGPGTGKTVVIIHRACALASRAGFTGKILVATYNVALAHDIRRKVASLGGKQTAARIEVHGVDALANQFFRDSVDEHRQRAKPAEVNRFWTEAIAGAGESADGFTPDFLATEYDEVILAGGLHERRQYLQAARRGRGRRLSRGERNTVWNLTSRFETLLEREQTTTFGKVAAIAADHAADQAASGVYKFNHILVDEAQDLNPQHWRMLRNLIPEGPNDLFLASDAHQRLYQKPIILSGLGINIRGRSTRLRLNYRTSREILSRTLTVLGEGDYEDFDDNTDTLSGYRSVLRGGQVDIVKVNRSNDELSALVGFVERWRTEDPAATIGIAAPTHELKERARTAIQNAGLTITELNAPDGKEPGRICVDTMFAMKGLEFRYLACFGLGGAHFPPRHLNPGPEDDAATRTRKTQRAQSLLFVTATRARDHLALIYSGSPGDVLKRLSNGRVA